MKISIHHWRHDDGWELPLPGVNITAATPRFFNKDRVGWYCWAYTDDDSGFEEWMKQNMKHTYDCTLRFNSGDPMHTVFISNDEDATMFKLTWM